MSAGEGAAEHVSRLGAAVRRAPKPLLALVCAALLGGCGGGGEGTIPSDDAEGLITLLDAIRADLDAGDCDLAADHATEFTGAVNGLPNEVDNDVQGALIESAARLAELSTDSAQCEAASSEEDVEQTTSTTTEQTSTSTTTTDEETTTTDEETDEEPADSDDEGEGAEEVDEGDDAPVEPPTEDPPQPEEPEVEVGPSESGGIDPERRRP